MEIVSERKNVSAAGFAATREFSMKAGGHLMAILSGLYENPEDAMVREYLTNMYDACLPLIKQGIAFRAPILRLPSKLNPTLEFQDFGIGMDFDTVWRVYAEYGNSTKSDSNDEVGGFGLGSKTAFCYNDGAPWNIVATKDGVTNRFMAFIGENGVPTLTHLSSEVKGLPNGVTVSIPIRSRDTSKIHTAAVKYIPFFPIELVVENMDEVPPKPVYMLSSESGDWGFFNRDVGYNRQGNLTVVMGNVPYHVSISEVFGWNYRGESVVILAENVAVIRVPIGAVDIVPSRDSLKFTERTLAAIKAMGQKIITELPARVVDVVGQCVTQWDRVKAEYDIIQNLQLPSGTLNAVKIGIGKMTIPVPSKVKAVSYKIDNSDVANPVVTPDITEFVVTPRMSRSKLTSVIIVNDTAKPAASRARHYIRENFANKGYSGRLNRYGHTPCEVYLVTLPSKMTVDQFKATLDGFDNVLLASTIVVAPSGVPSKLAGSGVYKNDGYGRWVANAQVDPTLTEFYYLPLTQENGKGRYRYRGSAVYSMIDMATLLECDGYESVLFGIRDKNVALLGPEWINFEEVVTDALIAKFKSAPKQMSLSGRQQDYDIAKWVIDMVPVSYAGQADIATRLKSVVKTGVTSKNNTIERLRNTYKDALSQTNRDRVSDTIDAIIASNSVSIDTIEEDALALVEGNPLIKLARLLAPWPSAHVREFLKENL